MNQPQGQVNKWEVVNEGGRIALKPTSTKLNDLRRFDRLVPSDLRFYVEIAGNIVYFRFEGTFDLGTGQRKYRMEVEERNRGFHITAAIYRLEGETVFPVLPWEELAGFLYAERLAASLQRDAFREVTEVRWPNNPDGVQTAWTYLCGNKCPPLLGILLLEEMAERIRGLSPRLKEIEISYLMWQSERYRGITPQELNRLRQELDEFYANPDTERFWTFPAPFKSSSCPY